MQWATGPHGSKSHWRWCRLSCPVTTACICCSRSQHPASRTALLVLGGPRPQLAAHVLHVLADEVQAARQRLQVRGKEAMWGWRARARGESEQGIYGVDGAREEQG